VVNLVGEQVYEYTSDFQRGWNELSWKPRSASSGRLGQGVYLYSISAGEHYAVKKLMME